MSSHTLSLYCQDSAIGGVPSYYFLFESRCLGLQPMIAIFIDQGVIELLNGSAGGKKPDLLLYARVVNKAWQSNTCGGEPN